jgi:hypothetical protein
MLRDLINVFNEVGWIGFFAVVFACVLLKRDLTIKLRGFLFRIGGRRDEDPDLQQKSGL